MDALTEAVANGEAIETEIIGDEATGQVLVIRAEPENIEAAAQLESDLPARKPTPKGNRKKGAATMDNDGK